MALLPSRHCSTSPQVWNRVEPRHDLARLDAMTWRPVRRRSFTPVILTIAGAAIAGFMVRSAIDHPRITPRLVAVERPAYVPSVAPPAGGPCAEADGTVRNGPRVGGFAPRDVFGFLPKCDGRR
jgi:hypothetical protein